MKYFHIVSILWSKDGMVERGAQTQAYAPLRERAVLGRQAFNKVMCSLNIYGKKCNVANTSYQTKSHLQWFIDII